MNLTLNPTAVDLSLSNASSKPNVKNLHDAAKQFEALMITEMLKTARETNNDGWLSDGDETGEDSSMSMAEGQFAQTIANSGGLGLAKMVERTMSNSAKSSEQPVSTAR